MIVPVRLKRIVVTIVGRCSHVAPLSKERSSARRGVPLGRMSVKKSITLPFGGTTIRLPMVCAFGPGS